MVLISEVGINAATFIVALLTESCLIELGGKYFVLILSNNWRLTFMANTTRKSKFLYIEFLNAMLKCVESYEDDRASELASMIDDIINPLITEQYKLLSLMRSRSSMLRSTSKI